MPQSTTVKIGFSQMACGEEPKGNLARQLALAEKALKQGANIFCTQEPRWSTPARAWTK